MPESFHPSYEKRNGGAGAAGGTGSGLHDRKGEGWAAIDFGEERELAQLRPLWTRIELEIIRVLEAGHALKESPDYELHRLTTQTRAFFDETVRRHVETPGEGVGGAGKRGRRVAKKIEELTGEVVPGIA